MCKRSAFWLAIAYGIATLSLIAGAMALPVRAQSLTSTPTIGPTATVNGGNAQWSIQSRTFASRYPKGFTFTIQATSTGGAIKAVKTFWRYSPSTRHSRAAAYDPAAKAWIMAWEPRPGEESVPAWVSIDYWFVLTDASDNSYITDEIHAEYTDKTRAWGRAESEDIIVYWEKSLPDQIGQLAIEAMAKNRELYRRAWGRLLSYKPRAILYANAKSFGEWAPGIDTEHILGTTSRTWGGTAQRNSEYGIVDLAYGTIPHEIGHLYQFDLGMVADSWWIEGDATFFELHQEYDYEQRARDLAQEADFPSLQDNIPTRGDNARNGYDIGYSFIKYLTNTYGIEVHQKILGYMTKGSVLFDAITKATGKPFDDVELGFRQWLGVPDPTLPTRVPTLIFEFPPTPTHVTIVEATLTPAP